MALWDLFFTSQPTSPPQLGVWYFLLPTSLVVVGVLSVRFAHSKGYQNFWYWGQLIQLLIINSWYLAARLPFSESLPFYHSRMAMWIILLAPKGSFKQYFALVGVFGSIMALVHPVFYPYPFPHVSSINNVFGHWALLANCLISLVQCLEDLSDDVWSQCHYCSGQPCNGWKLRLYASSSCARRPWPCSQLFHRDSPNDGDTDPHQYYRSVQ